MSCGKCGRECSYKKSADDVKIAEVREDDRVKTRPSKKPWNQLSYDEQNAFIVEYLGRGYYFD